MMGHKISFYEEILIIIPKLSLLLLLIWSPDIPPPYARSRAYIVDMQMSIDMDIVTHYIVVLIL